MPKGPSARISKKRSTLSKRSKSWGNPYASSKAKKRMAYVRRSLRGYDMAKTLPPSVALVVRKTGHEQHSSAIDAVYKEYGLKTLWSMKFPYKKAQLIDVYIKLLEERPELKQKLIEELGATAPKDRNALVELVYVPEKTIKKLHDKHPSTVNGPKTAMKEIAGQTDPKKALKKQKKTGTMTVRGEAYDRAREVPHVDTPTIANNVIHVPAGSMPKFTPHKMVKGEDEFYNHLAILVPDSIMGLVNKRIQQIKKQEKPKKAKKS